MYLIVIINRLAMAVIRQIAKMSFTQIRFPFDLALMTLALFPFDRPPFFS
mgnify:CR=1 FL=1|jgi:hypothetical protein